jgi:predicted nucleic acid-binding protein
MVLLDTSVIVRYLTDDPPEMAEQAARVLDGPQNVVISEVVLVETAHVLSSVSTRWSPWYDAAT